MLADLPPRRPGAGECLGYLVFGLRAGAGHGHHRADAGLPAGMEELRELGLLASHNPLTRWPADPHSRAGIFWPARPRAGPAGGGPDRPARGVGSGSAGGEAAVDWLVAAEADVGHAFAAGQPGELLLKAADLCGGQQGGDHCLLGVEPGDLSGRAEPGQG